MPENHCTPGFSPSQYPLLTRINDAPDEGIRQLSLRQLEQLAAELRGSLLEIVQTTGGHLASNLGVVELTIALHYVFDSPNDALLWDVGHQAYVHKMLTGRWRDFAGLRQYGGLYGFPRREESLHDHLNTGHAGTAISAGLGLELGRGLESQSYGKVLCVVGDASLTSGMAFEAMNHCGHQPNRLVVVMNDNEMSIASNVGAVSRILSRLTAGHSYVFIRDHINQLVRRIPLLGAAAYRGLLRMKGVVKKAVYRTNLFTEFGFKYIGPIYGHNIRLLVDTFERIAQLDEPVFLHVSTQKGKGLKEAEEAPAQYHGISPVTPARPVAQAARAPVKLPTFTASFSRSLLELEATCPELVCISAAMAGSTGLQPFAERHPQRFFDVGIAEQHALTLAVGLALAGKLPLLAIYSTFMQRAIDQLIHDISLMQLPAIFVCDRAGIVPGDGDTHQGIYDIVQFRSIIGLRLYSPATQQQLHACLELALRRARREVAEWQRRRAERGRHEFTSGPLVIRLPKRDCPDGGALSGTAEQSTAATTQYYPVSADETLHTGPRVLLLCTGSLLPEALAAQRILQQEAGPALDVLQLCQLAPLPWPEIEALLTSCEWSMVFCIEDGVVQGGVGQELLRHLMALQIHTGRLLPTYLRGVEGEVPQLGSYGQLLRDYGLDAVSLAGWICDTIFRGAL